MFALIGVSIWATGYIGVVPAIRLLIEQPAAGINAWFIATLFDAYFGFLWFWLWIAYKETGVFARLGWLVALLLAGNIGMAVYMLIQLYKLPPNAKPKDLLLRRA